MLHYRQNTPLQLYNIYKLMDALYATHLTILRSGVVVGLDQEVFFYLISISVGCQKLVLGYNVCMLAFSIVFEGCFLPLENY